MRPLETRLYGAMLAASSGTTHSAMEGTGSQLERQSRIATGATTQAARSVLDGLEGRRFFVLRSFSGGVGVKRD